jgi:two-component system phosphate regulon sensor histidine kinase PhoR
MFLSLRWRVALMYVTLLVVSLSTLGFYLGKYFNQSFLHSLQEQLLSEANLITTQIHPLILAGAPYVELNDQVKTISETITTRVTVILPDGQVIAESTRSPDLLENHLSRPEIQRALLGDQSTESRYSSTTHQPMLYAAVPIFAEGQVTAIIRLSVPQDYITKNTRIVSQVILVTTLITATIAILLAILLTNFTTKPLHQLTTRVRSMINEENIFPLKRKSIDEVTQLSIAFDTLSTQLTTQISALQNERTKLEAILSNMTDGVIMVGEQDQVALINPAAAKLFQIDQSSALNHSIVEVVRQYQIVDLWRNCRNSHQPKNMALEIIQSKIFIQAFAIPLPLIGPDYVLLVIQDLTRVHRLETVRRDFISNISHELRTPLASLKALSETLQEGALDDPPAARRFLAQMEREIDNLAQMVNELLELSRIESGKVPLNRRPVQPLQLLEDARSRMAMQAERAGISLQVVITEELSSVLADPSRISQVLLNLLHNAIKFTPPGGNISLMASDRDYNVVFSIQDTGVGIAPQDLQRIFERFYKTDRSRSGGGTGLGLSISRHIIEAHGGRIWAESTEGAGSTFFFSIPKAS